MIHHVTLRLNSQENHKIIVQVFYSGLEASTVHNCSVGIVFRNCGQETMGFKHHILYSNVFRIQVDK